MTLSQEMVWTALPNGLGPDGKPRLSAMLTPRLRVTGQDPPRLDSFPDFLDWPESVNASTFQVLVDGQTGAIPASRESPPADSGLWEMLFAATTLVRPFRFKDFALRNIRSFPIAGVMSYLSGIYREIARFSPADLPLVGEGGEGTLKRLVDDLGSVLGHYRLPHGPGALQRLRRTDPDRLKALVVGGSGRRFHALDGAFADSRVVDPGADPGAFHFASQAAMDFYQAHRFYDRPEMIQPYMEERDTTKIPAPPKVPTLDFHQMLSILGDYPVLLRRLGLVVDLVVDHLEPPSGVLRLAPSPGPVPQFAGSTTVLTPGTRYQRTATSFRAASKPEGDLADGMLRLEGAHDRFEGMAEPVRFHLVQTDADGAALKLVNMASELLSVHGENSVMGVSFDTPDRAGLPALRSAGVALIKTDRASALAARLLEEQARAGTDVGDLVHHADHLLRGYRLDVRDEDGIWRSLCRRKGSYRVHLPSGGTFDVSPPDQPIVDEGYVKSASATSADDKDSDLYLHETLCRWDGWSVVAKRPGRTILPSESVDRLTQDEKIERYQPQLETEFKLETGFIPVEGSLPRLRFGRRYAFRARAVDLAGNSVGFDDPDDAHASEPLIYNRFEPVPPPAIVPRAKFGEGESVERMVIRSDFDQTATQYAAVNPAYQPSNDRHVVPPKTSQLLAETHGCFDAAFGPDGQPGPEFIKAAREAGTLKDAEGSVMVAGAVPPDASAEAVATGAYLINTSPVMALPYLPDPMSRGVAFRGLPGESLSHCDFSGDWPDLAPLVLRIAEKPGGVLDGDCHVTFDPPGTDVDWNETERVLTVFLGKADVATVRYSSGLPEGGLDVMAVWQRWLAESDDADSEMAQTGGHWMISPFRELVLVHAVQRPLCPPSVRLRSMRGPGDTFAEVFGKAFLSVKSTGQLDLHASWSDEVDSLSQTAPQTLEGRGHVVSVRVERGVAEPEPWAEEPPGADGTLPVPGEGGMGFPGDDSRADRVKHEFGDTKHRWVNYRLTGTTRFREYFPASVTADAAAITRQGPDVRVNIRSSARPDAPRVLYVVPSFKWTSSQVGPKWTTLSRTRGGGGLRVWMSRPWYSSGEGEKLGVVLAPSGALPTAMTKLVSRFGIDPAWDSALPGTALQAKHFANSVDHDDSVTLDETTGTDQSGAAVGVVAFEPEYDEDRRLWFCDIDLVAKSSPSYFPFVQLVLARYQRDSVGPGLKVSRVVQTDFAQLLPPRTLTVSFRGATTLDVTLYGPAPDGPYSNRVEVTLEHHDGETPGDLGWERVTPAPDRPNPVVLSDGMPDVSWIPPDIPSLFRSRDSLIRSNERFRARGGRIISRHNLPMIEEARIPEVIDVDPSVVKGVGDVPVITLQGYELWSGAVELPPDQAALGPLRLVVREYEHFAADDDTGRLDTDEREPHIHGLFADRVVYADIVELPAPPNA
ncbi:MAG: hypothetical protein AVDCRST_MAG76-320 [uncultured Acidimicrobiales bacterium]|uniref:Uncharacterized protein n=1 Tax=uncultured Acidimicrobiales bacterium TaxID=310071 RepID=A0A6J4H8B3_9ACTN|nr:MAG: hypothetical protein AVDCRST_MAG76-320 [uncultured Acidimicrobiales bacterium]